MPDMPAKIVQFPPANGKQGPAALTNKKQANFDLLYADNLVKQGRGRLKVPILPKREIFDRSDFPDFYIIKYLRVGDFGVKIKNLLKNI
jgi:hypothetical protein